MTSLLEDVIRDADEQPDEEVHRVRSGRVLSAEASVPVELGCGTFVVCGSSLNPLLLEFYGGFITWASSIINSISSPSPLSEEWGVRLKISSF